MSLPGAESMPLFLELNVGADKKEEAASPDKP
jgi:hypothetical protein